MNRIQWTLEDTLVFNNCISNLFKVTPSISSYKKSISNRLIDLSTFLDKIKYQIIQYNIQDLPYSTPQEWDESYNLLPTNYEYSTYKSSSILSRMSWSEFLDKSTLILNEYERRNSYD